MTIALIIPIWNSEKWLRRCLESIERQTIPFDDVILVDDCSQDGTYSICSEYEKKYENFSVFTITQHDGVSSARNQGLYMEHIWSSALFGDTEFVTFLDADDELIPDACEKMRKAIEDNPNENIIQFNHWRKYEGVEQLRMKHHEWPGRYSLNDMPTRPLVWFAVWNKIYRRKFLQDFDIWFNEHLEWGEDLLFNVEAILANGGLSCEENATCIRHFENKQSLNHLYRDAEHEGLLINELEKIKDKHPRIIGEIIAEHKENQRKLA